MIHSKFLYANLWDQMRFFALKIFFLLCINSLQADGGKYWVYLNTMEDTVLVDQWVRTQPAGTTNYYSSWLNAYCIPLDLEGLQVLANKPWVAAIVKAKEYALQAADTLQSLGFGLEQTQAQILLDHELTGKGVKIGIIDGGFLKANEDKTLEHLFQNNQIKVYRDYITPGMSPYEGSKALNDRHGTDVLQVLAGVNEGKNIRLGLASDADYYLVRTDHGGSERKIEEVYLVRALEWLDSLGVRLVNISLGYTDGFDDKSENYTPADIDGTSALARAIDYAFEEKGMLMVISAGNDGNKNWHILSTPADARHALSVGSTKYKHWDKASFSSVGPRNLPYLKPDVSCFSSQGTSFSAPIITGLAAAIWQYDSTLTNQDVKDVLTKSGHLYPYANNYVGYGVPSGDRILRLLEGEKINITPRIKVTKNMYRLDRNGAKQMVVYHKTDAHHVIKEQYIRMPKKVKKIRRHEKAIYTTIILDNKDVIELQWMRK